MVMCYPHDRFFGSGHQRANPALPESSNWESIFSEDRQRRCIEASSCLARIFKFGHGEAEMQMHETSCLTPCCNERDDLTGLTKSRYQSFVQVKKLWCGVDWLEDIHIHLHSHVQRWCACCCNWARGRSWHPFLALVGILFFSWRLFQWSISTD